VRAAALAVAGVAAVRLALVDQLERYRLERGEARADLGSDVQVFSSPAYLPSTRAWAKTKSSMRPMPPNSLNDAQIFSE